MDDFNSGISRLGNLNRATSHIKKLNMRQPSDRLSKSAIVPIGVAGHTSNRAGVSAVATIVTLIIFLIVGIGIYSWLNSGDEGPSFAPITSEVTRGDFVSKVLDQGEIESSANIEIRCEVKARNGEVSVLKAADEGIEVKPGDFLVQLDSASFDKELEAQNIAIATAQTKVIKAETVLETAKASKREYEEGVFVEALQTFENDIFDAQSQISTANQELEQSIAVMEHSEKLHSRGFITQRQLNADQFAVEKAKIAIKKAENLLSLAKQKKKVLVEVTQEKELTQLDAEIRAAKVDLNSQQQSFEVEKQKLADINEAIAKCRIVAPPGVEGQLVYAKESRGRGDEWVLEEGASVRENQVLVRVPDPKKMQVKALINEQSITQIEPNMPATVQVDALNSVSLKGIVVKVNQYAESKGWFGSNVRKYAVFIRIIDPPLSLKPGMNASVSIQSRFEKDTLLAPLQTVYSVQGRSFCLVKNGDRYDTKEVAIGGDNSKMVMFKDGVNVGDELVMNPGSFKERMELPEVLADESIDLPDNVTLVKTEGKAGTKAKGGGKPSGRPVGGGRPAGDGGRTSGMVNGMMSKYDTNSDGKIDAGEMASLDSRAKNFIGGADSDSDGTVTKAEMTKAAEKMMSQRSGGGGGPGGGGARPATSTEGSSGGQP
jgi:multidrug resistance efflux pump